MLYLLQSIFYYCDKLNTVYTDKAVKIVDWGDIKVPKYDKSKMWALTSKEQEEILGSNWPIEFRKQRYKQWKNTMNN